MVSCGSYSSKRNFPYIPGVFRSYAPTDDTCRGLPKRFERIRDFAEATRLGAQCPHGGRRAVENVDEIRVLNMQLVWVDPDNWAFQKSVTDRHYIVGV